MASSRPEALPVDAVLEPFIRALSGRKAAVLTAPPGAGKTTRVPSAILDSNIIGDQNIWVLEPRRLAARLAAKRVAEERGATLGAEVGYQVRFDSRVSKQTRITFLTEGLLNKKLEADPALEGVGVVVIDELHERSIHADLALGFLSEIRATLRPDLLVVAMSATIDAEPIARFLGGDVVRSEGRMFPVEIVHDERPDDRRLEDRIGSAVRRALAESEGDVLAFLPGAGEIHRAKSVVEPLAVDRADVFVLYGDLEPAKQDAAVARGTRRKIVLSTNVAETSLTIPGVTCVIDSGLVKVLRHDPSRGMDALVLTRTSRASADQRAGRAGRTGPGRAYRLWTASEHRSLAAYDRPEIERIDLSSVLLSVLGWAERDPRAFTWFEAPPEASIERGLELLRSLGAVAPSAFKLTPKGRALLELPVHPRIGALLLEARRRGAGRRGALVAAVLGERDVLYRSVKPPTSRSDVIDRLELVEELERSRFSASLADRLGLDVGAARAVCRARDQLVAIAGIGRDTTENDRALTAAILAGYADRVARRRERSDRVRLVGGRGARLSPESAVREAELLVVVDVEDKPGQPESLVRQASAVSREDLKVTEARSVRWNESRDAAEGILETRYFDLVLGERTDPNPDEAALASLLAERAGADLERALSLDPRTEALLKRVVFARRHVPEAEVPELRAHDLVRVLSSGRRSFADLRKADAFHAALELLGPKRGTLETIAPERFEVPTGSKIVLGYDGDVPVLGVRLQEVFGMAETPRIARGRVALKMELLSPGYRPVQVTQDLRSFWTTTYPEVRRELRARYPKHAWPEDPWTAPPQRKGRSRSS
ncbi:MAG: ATP-dependent helicase HrpB [Deltaproteobacteria bacterium]|nr:ATP-dependent helicase HrpB [Deltaproteobacteria bacterium]